MRSVVRSLLYFAAILFRFPVSHH